jgi:hypothetical protein
VHGRADHEAVGGVAFEDGLPGAEGEEVQVLPIAPCRQCSPGINPAPPLTPHQWLRLAHSRKPSPDPDLPDSTCRHPSKELHQRPKVERPHFRQAIPW